MKIRICVSAFLLCLSVSVVNAKGKFTFNQGSINKKEFHQIVPFEWVLDKVIIQAEVNGQKGRYIVDTGAMCIIFKDSTRKQNYRELIRMKISDANKKTKTSQVVQVPEIKIGDIEYSNIPALYIDPLGGPLQCFGVDGLIGSNLLRFGAFKIDVKERQLILADSFQDFKLEHKQGINMKLNKMQNSPYISLRVNGHKQKNVLVDTGSGGIYAFSDKLAHSLKRKGKLSAPKYVSSGTNSHGAWGVDGSERKTKIWQIHTISIGDVNINNCLLRSDKTSSRIGMNLLENGEFILDYPQKRFFFLPFKEEIKDLSIAGFGIDFVSINDTIIVNGIWEKSLAAKSKLQKGDVLIDVVGLELRGTSLCEKFSVLKTVAKSYDRLEFVFQKRENDEEFKLLLDRLK